MEGGEPWEKDPANQLSSLQGLFRKVTFFLYSDLLNTHPSSMKANLFILQSLPLLLSSTYLGGLFLTEAEKNVALGLQQTKITPKNSFPASINQ